MVKPSAFSMSQSNALAAAVQWLSGTLLGSMATAIGVIAVGCFGFLLLTGRVDVRRDIQVILGCFILFGASAIAAGLMTAVRSDGQGGQPAASPAPPPVYPASATRGSNVNSAYDPYAGAAGPKMIEKIQSIRTPDITNTAP